MGFLTDLRTKYGTEEFNKRVDNAIKFSREDFVNPNIGETKWFRVAEHPRFVPEIKTHDAFVVKVDEIVSLGLDEAGNEMYKTLRDNVSLWLGLNTSAQLVGKTIKKLTVMGKQPDDDMTCTINSVWSITADENPKAAEKGYKSDKMYTFGLISLDQKIVDTILGGTGQISVENISGPSPM